jgi:hypothetical protein
MTFATLQPLTPYFRARFLAALNRANVSLGSSFWVEEAEGVDLAGEGSVVTLVL